MRKITGETAPARCPGSARLTRSGTFPRPGAGGARAHESNEDRGGKPPGDRERGGGPARSGRSAERGRSPPSVTTPRPGSCPARATDIRPSRAGDRGPFDRPGRILGRYRRWPAGRRGRVGAESRPPPEAAKPPPLESSIRRLAITGFTTAGQARTRIPRPWLAPGGEPEGLGMIGTASIRIRSKRRRTLDPRADTGLLREGGNHAIRAVKPGSRPSIEWSNSGKFQMNIP